MRIGNRSSRRLLPIVVMAATIGACATVPKRSYPTRDFGTAKIERVAVGVAPEAVEMLFGKPDVVYDMTFGKDTGTEWSGVAWRYYAVRDSRYQHADEWKANTFYFAKAGDGSLKLNHWVIEHRTGALP